MVLGNVLVGFRPGNAEFVVLAEQEFLALRCECIVVDALENGFLLARRQVEKVQGVAVIGAGEVEHALVAGGQRTVIAAPAGDGGDTGLEALRHDPVIDVLFTVFALFTQRDLVAFRQVQARRIGAQKAGEHPAGVAVDAIVIPVAEGQVEIAVRDEIEVTTLGIEHGVCVIGVVRRQPGGVVCSQRVQPDIADIGCVVLDVGDMGAVTAPAVVDDVVAV